MRCVGDLLFELGRDVRVNCGGAEGTVPEEGLDRF